MGIGLQRMLNQQTYALVLAGGRGSRLHELTNRRAKPAVPFAGTLRIVDFALGNCVNSGLRRIGVLTQYKSQSLIRHVERSWGFLDASLDEYVEVVPAQQQLGDRWYSGTANAVFQNLEILGESGARHVLVLCGDHVYRMDYGVMVAEHAARGAQLSVACIEIPLSEAREFGVMRVDGDGRVTAFDEKPACPAALPGKPDAALISMGIYVFELGYLAHELARDDADIDSSHDFGKDMIPRLLDGGRVFAHRFEASCVGRPGQAPYWRDVGTLDAYWSANLDLTQDVPELDLHDADWPLHGRQPSLAPAKFVFDQASRRGMALDSLVAGGCVVSGATVRRSVLVHGVRVDEGSRIEDSVVLPDTRIGRGVQLRRAIVDSRCVLPDGLQVGLDAAFDRERFRVTARGVTLVVPEMLLPH